MFRFVLCAIALSGFAVAPEEESAAPQEEASAVVQEEECCPEGQRHYRVTVRHIERGGIGYEDGYTTLEAFLASDPSQWRVTPFLDARGHLFDNGKWAANAGVGLRTLLGNRAYGINTYYDYRNTGRFHSNQVGAGIETLGELFDFRINGYLPIGTKISNPYAATFGTFSGHYMLISQKYQSAMKGADAEFGFHFGKSKSFDFYAAAGPYYFIGEKAPSTWGGKARISGVFKDMLTLEISDSYDKTFHNKFQGQISLSFSFGPKSKVKEQGRTCKVANTLNDRMLQQVSRQEIIVIDKTRENTVAIDPATGLPYFFVFVDNTSSSDGTYESPYHSLAQAQANSSPNDVIYIFPGDGTSTGMNTGITLQGGQQLLGAGTGQNLNTPQGLIYIPPQAESMPLFSNALSNLSQNAAILLNSGNNVVSGISIFDTHNSGGLAPLFVRSGSNYLIQNNIVSSAVTGNCMNVGEFGFTVGNIQIINNTFIARDNQDVFGLEFDGSCNGATIIANNLFTGLNASSGLNEGILIQPSTILNGSSYSILNNTFNSQSNTDGSALAIDMSLTPSNINIITTFNGNNINIPVGMLTPFAGMFIERAGGGTGIFTVNLTNNISTTINPTPGYLFINTSGSPSLFPLNLVNNIGTVSGP